MAPFYAREIIGPQRNDDVPRIQNLYGKPVSEPEPPVVPPVVPPVTPPVTPPTKPFETVIRLKGVVTDIAIDGYRVQKMG